MLPQEPDATEMLVLSRGQVITHAEHAGRPMPPHPPRSRPVVAWQFICVKPKVFAKGVCRCCFIVNKFAFPCDEEVPFALAGFGIKCAEKPPGALKQCIEPPAIAPPADLCADCPWL